jgi:hypothetical protein
MSMRTDGLRGIIGTRYPFDPAEDRLTKEELSSLTGLQFPSCPFLPNRQLHRFFLGKKLKPNGLRVHRVGVLVRTSVFIRVQPTDSTDWLPGKSWPIAHTTPSHRPCQHWRIWKNSTLTPTQCFPIIPILSLTLVAAFLSLWIWMLKFPIPNPKSHFPFPHWTNSELCTPTLTVPSKSRHAVYLYILYSVETRKINWHVALFQITLYLASC